MDPNQNDDPNNNFANQPRPNDVLRPQSQQSQQTPPPEQYPPFESAPEDITPAPAPAKQRSRFARILRSKLFIFGLIVLVLALLAGGAWYYSNTNRVMRDVFVNSIKADKGQFDGTLTYTSKDENSSLKSVTSQFSGKNNGGAFSMETATKISAGAADLNIDLDFATNQEASYVKLSNATELADLAGTLTGGGSAIEDYKPLAEKLDNTWIKLQNPSGDSENENEGQSQCNLDEMRTILNNNANMLGDIFKRHQFVTAERSGFSFTEQEYDLSFDQAAGKSFAEEFMQTDAFKTLRENCGVTDRNLPTDQAEQQGTEADVQVKLWVDPLTHEPKKLAVTATDESYEVKLELNLRLNQETEVAIPTDATSFEDLMQSYFEEAFQKQVEQLQDSGEITPEQLEQFQQYQLEANSQSL